MPLAAHRLLDTRDLDESRELTARLFGPRRSTSTRPHAPFQHLVHDAALGVVGLTYQEHHSWIDVHESAAGRHYLAGMPLDGRVSCVVGVTRADGAPGHGVVCSPTLPNRYRTFGHIRLLVLRVDAAALREELSARLQATPAAPLAFEASLDLAAAAGARLSHLAARLAEQIDAPDGRAWRRSLAAAHFERVVLGALLDAPNNYSARLAAPELPASASVARTAADFIMSRLDTPLTVGAIANACGVSARTLHRAFAWARGESPMAFLRRARLERVRADLLAGEPPTTVTTAAYRWGFTHMGRFSQEYARAFGELPSVSLRRR